MKKMESPVDLLIAIVNRHKGHNVCEILNDYKVQMHLNCIGHGTAESTLADLFGFGIVERDIVISLVPVTISEKILNKLNREFHFNERHNGLAMTIPVNSIEKNLLDFIKVLKK
jgi:hypothetical protein